MGSPRTALSCPHPLPPTSRLPCQNLELSWPYSEACYCSISSWRATRIQKARKWTKSHWMSTACSEFPFPSGWLQQKLVGLDRESLLQHPQPNIPLRPQRITETHTGVKQCLPHKKVLAVLSARCFNAKDTCMCLNMCLYFSCPTFSLLN